MDRNLFLALTLSATFQCLAQTPEPFEVRRAEPVFEELPELKASEILKPELLKGPHFVVRDPVPTGSGMNQFTIDSDFGVFEADGNATPTPEGDRRDRAAAGGLTYRRV
jgi:hypothetical protein